MKATSSVVIKTDILTEACNDYPVSIPIDWNNCIWLNALWLMIKIIEIKNALNVTRLEYMLLIILFFKSILLY